MQYAVIPAAGLATRFLPASKAIPKEMFPIYDRPVIQHIVEEAIACEIDKIVFVSREGKESILDHFDSTNPKFAPQNLSKDLQDTLHKLDSIVDVVSIRQKEAKGLGDAVLTGCKLFSDEPFAVILPDVMIVSRGAESCLQKMVKLYKEHGASVIALMHVPDEDRKKYGMAEGIIKGNIMEIDRLIEKPEINETNSNLAIVGRYIFTPSITGIIKDTKPGKKNEIQLTDAMIELARREKMIGLILDDNDLVFDAGDITGYALANAFVAAQKIPGFKDMITKLWEK